MSGEENEDGQGHKVDSVAAAVFCTQWLLYGRDGRIWIYEG